MNQFGQIFRLQVWGESHGPMVGVVLDGVPPGIPLDPQAMMGWLDRRKSGAKGTTPRKEPDRPQFLAGTYEGLTTGAPLVIGFPNTNVRSKDYKSIKTTPRPGHADFVALKKYGGFNDPRGGGHFSGRLTVLLVAAGYVAQQIIQDIKIEARLVEAGGQADISAAVDQALAQGDSIGGIIECRAHGLPVGFGEPFFDSVESMLAHIVFAIPAIKGIEFGSGFGAARMKGSEHNDALLDVQGQTATNHAGGINGGITNGNELVYRVVVKPTSSISKAQKSVDLESGEVKKFEIKGRHDACIALRVPVVLEAVTAIVLADFSLRSQAVNPVNAHQVSKEI